MGWATAHTGGRLHDQTVKGEGVSAAGRCWLQPAGEVEVAPWRGDTWGDLIFGVLKLGTFP